jgi:hypothetical protein
LDVLISTKEPIESHAQSSTLSESSSQQGESKAIKADSLSSQASNERNTSPNYIRPSVATTDAENASSLHVDTSNNPFASQWDSYNRRYPDLISPSSYTPKIRHRHFSVGSYYDNKTTTVAIHPNHTFFILGSAPVSPLGRISTANSDSSYYVQHHSPLVYETIAYNTLRRVSPYVDSNDYVSPYEYTRPSSLTRDEPYRTTTTTTTYSPRETEPVSR